MTIFGKNLVVFAVLGTLWLAVPLIMTSALIMGLTREPDTVPEAFLFLGSIWVVLVAMIASIWLWVYQSRTTSGRSTAVRVMLISIPFGCIGVASAVFLQQSRPSVVIDTEADARAAVEKLLIRDSQRFSDRYRVIELKQQIRNLTVQGPGTTYDPETARYVSFQFDTGCGKVVKLTTTFGIGEPSHIYGFKDGDCLTPVNR